MQIDRRSTQSCGHLRPARGSRTEPTIGGGRPSDALEQPFEPASNGALHVPREREKRDGDRANCTLIWRGREVSASSTDQVGTANVPEFAS